MKNIKRVILTILTIGFLASLSGCIIIGDLDEFGDNYAYLNVSITGGYYRCGDIQIQNSYKETIFTKAIKPSTYTVSNLKIPTSRGKVYVIIQAPDAHTFCCRAYTKVSKYDKVNVQIEGNSADWKSTIYYETYY